MVEYTLVFRRAVARDGRAASGARDWEVLRPALGAPGAPEASAPHEVRPGHRNALAQVFAVPICSALGMDIATYERFLLESGALRDALGVLSGVCVTRANAVTTARKEIQALVMAAEVQHIVGSLSA